MVEFSKGIFFPILSLIPIVLSYLYLSRVFKGNYIQNTYRGSIVYLRFLSIIFYLMILLSAFAVLIFLSSVSKIEKALVYIFCPPFILYALVGIGISAVLPKSKLVSLTAWSVRKGQNPTLF